MKNKATIKDVAERAGVSIGTVDRVLHKRGRYSESSAEAVNKAILELNYRPSQVASALVSMKKQYTIGVNYPLSRNDSKERFWSDAKKGVEKAAEELAVLGIRVVTFSTESFSDETRFESLREMIERRVDAIVTAPFSDDDNRDYSSLIPPDVPYATVVNRTWNDSFLFHIGPDDEAMGALAAACVRLYCGEKARVAILAPNMQVESTHKRIQGFVTKLSKEYPEMVLSQVLPIVATNFTEAYRIIREETAAILRSSPDLSAIYVTNGFIRPAADVIREERSSVKLFGHEYFSGIRDYLEDGSIAATVCQEPFKQWYQAVMTMANYLMNGSKPDHVINADCSLMIRETVPLLPAYISQGI